MSRRGREGAPGDEQLLAALDRLVEVEGIVKAAELLEVSYRTASNCHESRHVSRKMRGVLEKHVRGACYFGPRGEQLPMSLLNSDDELAEVGPQPTRFGVPANWYGETRVDSKRVATVSSGLKRSVRVSGMSIATVLVDLLPDQDGGGAITRWEIVKRKILCPRTSAASSRAGQ